MYQHIIAAVDGSPHAARALEQAGQLARQVHAPLTLVHIVNLQALARVDNELIPTPELLAQARLRGQALLDQASRQLQAQLAMPVQIHLGESWHGKRDMAAVLVRYAREMDADLLVLATHGRSGMLHMLMGSFIENVMRLAPCPLMIVRSGQDSAQGEIPRAA